MQGMSPREIVSGKIWPTRWKLRLLRPVSSTLAVAVAMFVVAAIALAVNLNWQRESFDWVEHTNAVLRTVSALERRILEAESGERGYLLTGESTYLDSYNRRKLKFQNCLRPRRRRFLTIQVRSNVSTNCARALMQGWPNSSRSSSSGQRV